MTMQEREFRAKILSDVYITNDQAQTNALIEIAYQLKRIADKKEGEK
jgi:hypothetical protein